MFNKLTENVGESIKKFAKILYKILIVISILSMVAGVITLIIGLFASFDGEILAIAFSLIGASVVVFLGCIITTMFLYGFGELIMLSKEIEKNTSNDKDKPKKLVSIIEPEQEKVVEKEPIQEFVRCPNCHKDVKITNQDKEWGDIKCPHCDKYFDL